jgi:hypothetical protein
LKKQRLINTILLILFTSWFSIAEAQMITGVWTGKINRQKVEVKIIQNGDGLTGTVYYYESASSYRRYSIKGYFDPSTNEAVWWDDQLIEEKKNGNTSHGKVPLLSRADFNCPGYGRMMLGGKASGVDSESEKPGDVNLDKTDWSNFTDEWDFVLENFTVGANDRDIIDSIDLISVAKKQAEDPMKAILEENPLISKPIEQPTEEIHFPMDEIKIIVPSSSPVDEPLKIPVIEEKFITRKKLFATEIPVSGDSIELHFYDNAQIDGDSISLFLNDKLIFEHIRLTDKPYTVKLPVRALNLSNELIMVAENLGSIPPNTSYMVALVEGKRYEARLESTEGSNAMIRLIRKGL